MAGSYFNNAQSDSIKKKIAEKLIENQSLLKLLYYNTSDALSQPDLDGEIKGKMINQKDISSTKIFYHPTPKIVQDTQKSELRFYVHRFKPENIILTNLMYCFEVIVHDNLWTLDEGLTRPDEIIRQILISLNGEEVNGIGLMYFTDAGYYYKFSEYHNGYLMFGHVKST